MTAAIRSYQRARIHGAAIAGVKVINARQIHDDRGMVMHIMRKDSPHFERFGEVYMSVVNPGVIKGWKKHLEIVQNYAVGTGAIRLVIYDDRPNSDTFGNIQIIETGRDQYAVIRIPPGVWYAAQGISSDPAVITNCTTLEHFDDDILRLPADTEKIPYRFSDHAKEQ